MIIFFLKAPFLKGIEWQSIGLWCESTCPQVKGRGGEEEGCLKADSSGLGVYDDELQPCSLGRAMGMETIWIHSLRDKDMC